MITKKQPHIIGVANDAASLEAAAGLPPGGEVDFIEVRVDAFYPQLGVLDAALPKLRLPVLLTVRSPDEGGLGNLDATTRRALALRYLPQASLLDVEVASAEVLADLIREARERGITVVLSAHDFTAPSDLTRFHGMAAKARALGADVFKVAAMADTPEALFDLLKLLGQESAELPTAVMGMGRYGKLSRLLLAQAGSVLNYGFLGRAVVPGQWDARIFRERLAELGAL